MNNMSLYLSDASLSGGSLLNSGSPQKPGSHDGAKVMPRAQKSKLEAIHLIKNFSIFV